MFHAMSFIDSTYTIIVGTDCPEISIKYIETSLILLSKNRNAVIGPAEDGGYVLLGLRCIVEDLFQNILWGTEHVFSQTTHKLDASKYNWQALDTLWDLDDIQDMARYQRLKMV